MWACDRAGVVGGRPKIAKRESFDGPGPSGEEVLPPSNFAGGSGRGGGDADRLSRGLRTSWSCLSAGEFRGLMIPIHCCLSTILQFIHCSAIMA